jgi:hypothetical protein
MPLPFVALRPIASLVLCTYGVILEIKWMLRLINLMTNFNTSIMPLPFVALWFGASSVLSWYGTILKIEWILKLI